MPPSLILQHPVGGEAGRRGDQINGSLSLVSDGCLSLSIADGDAMVQHLSQLLIRSARTKLQGQAKKNLAKFSDICSVRADGLCIGSTRSVGGRMAEISNMQELFCTTL